MPKPRWLVSHHEPALRMALLSVVVGVVVALAAVVFRKAIAAVHNFAFFGTWSLHYEANLPTPASPWGPWIIAAPVLGGLVVVFLVRRFAPEARGHGVPEVIDAIYYGRGVIRPKVALVKAAASSLTIGTGGAVGREGPIIQVGSAMGSAVGQWLRLPEWQRITLIAGGAASGIAATFNTPVGGLLFAVELLLPETSARTLVPVTLAAGAGAFVGELAFGNVPSFTISAFAATSEQLLVPGAFVGYVALGLTAGVVSLLYTRAIYFSEDLFRRLPVNDYVRHALGMAVVGGLMYLFLVYYGHYYVQGVGYATVQSILHNVLTDPLLLGLLFGAKLLATSLTLGSGGSGGVFSPSLFLGATLGAGFAVVGNTFVPGLPHLDPASLAVIGMAGVFGSATGAVVTAIVMIFEMTRDYHVILPLMIVVSIAYGVRRLILRDSIYTFKLTRRGHYIPDSLQSNLFMLRRVADMVETPVVRLNDTATLADLRYLAKQSGHAPHLLVVDEDDRIKGVLSMERHRRLGPDDTEELYVEEHIDTDYITVGNEDMVFDVVAQLRVSGAEIALVTRNGAVETAADVVGVLSLHDIARSSNLAAHMLRRPVVTG